MAWTEITRPHYVRDGLRYASDLTEAEWKLIEALMPRRRPIGRPRETDLRAVVNAILYMASTGCQWRQLPRDFPPWSTVQGYFYEWSRSGTFVAINHMLVMAARENAGREAEVPHRHRHRRSSGRPCGSTKLISRIVMAVGVLSSVRFLHPWLRYVFADGGYAGDKLRDALRKIGTWTIAIIKRSGQASGFEVLPRRWVVERTFAWLGRCRRLAKDFETTVASAVAWVFVAHIRTFTRRLARA
jgi:transposase